MIQLSKFFLVIIFIAAFASTSCVKKKLFNAEFLARETCEARELVMLRELADRKRETSQLIKDIAALNRSIGNLENQNSDLLADSENKLQQYGATEAQLRNDLTAAQLKVNELKTKLTEKNAKLKAIEDLEASKLRNNTALNDGLSEVMAPWQQQGLNCEIENNRVKMTLPNRLLFDSKGLNIPNSGRTVLMALSNYLNQHPEIGVEIQAHTDIELPPTMSDTWDWSAHRARSICKLLVQEYNVNANQLTPVLKGEYSPIASNQTAEGREQNRRTELYFTYIY